MHFGEGARCRTLWATRICPGLWREATYSFVGSTCVLFGALVRSRFSGVGLTKRNLPHNRSSTNGNIVNVNQMPDSSFLYNTDIADLAGAESFHDTQTVQVTGEVVGDHINDELDSNLCWITLQSTKADDYSLVSVLMTNEQAKLIENYGNYNTDGTILQVRGTFYLSCSEHQGLSDIHAKEVTVVKQGSPRKHPVNDAVLWTSCLAVGLGVLSLFTYSFLRERRK